MYSLIAATVVAGTVVVVTECIAEGLVHDAGGVATLYAPLAMSREYIHNVLPVIV